MISQGAFYHIRWWQGSFLHSFMSCSESYVYQTHMWTVGYGECDSWSPFYCDSYSSHGSLSWADRESSVQ